MRNWLLKLLGGKPADQEKGEHGERVVALEREVQILRLDLEEQTALADRLTQELERERAGAGARVAGQVQAQVERLLADAGAPVAQLHTQSHLLEQGRPVQARDVMAVARRLMRVLEDHGLAPESSVGARVPFDPDRHEPLSAATAIRPGRPVVVRFVGMRYRDKLLRKAGVEPADREE